MEAPDSWPVLLTPTNGESGEMCKKISGERKNTQAFDKDDTCFEHLVLQVR